MQEELEEIKQDRRKKKEDMSIEEMRHEQQLVDYKIKDITNDLGYKRFRGEKIDEEYERDCEIRIRKLKQDFNEWGSEVRKKEQAYNEERYSAARRRMLSITFDDEDDYIPLGDIIARYSMSKAITPDLPIKEPDNSLTDFDPNDDTSSDDDDFEDIEYVSFEEVNDVEQEEKEFDLEDILQIQDVILREKLLKISCLITNIKSLKDNPTPIPVTDSDSSDTFLSHLDNSLPEFESFSDHTEETRSGSTTTYANCCLPGYESFHFDNPSFSRPPPEPPDVEICLNFESDTPVIDSFEEINEDQRGSENVLFQNDEDDDSFTFVIRTFLTYLTYPEVSPYLAPSGVKIRFLTPTSSLRAGGISFASPRTI
ncbi:hypothetical protein Tco_1073053 [Tanacetum coccineum]